MRFQSYSQRDTPDTGDIDPAFLGLDMTRDKPLLNQGFISRGENTRLRTGRVRQREGTIIPNDFNPGTFTARIIGSGVFRNPISEEVLLIGCLDANHVWALQDGKDFYKINLVAGQTLAGKFQVKFVQAFEKVLLLRRPVFGSPALVWDGTGDTNGDGIADTTFVATTLSPEGLTLVPATWNGEPFMDRVVYYNDLFPAVAGTSAAADRDRWIVSDIEDYTSYDDIYQAFTTNPGESDYITRIMSYFKGSVVVFKSQSIHMVTFAPTFPVAVNQRILNRSLGSIGAEMPLMIGGDIIFLSQPNGFYRLSEVIQDQITTLPLPISEPIQSVIDSIDWNVTKYFGCSVALGNYAFFGVHVGAGGVPGTTGLNTILVYDTQRKQWESAGDTWRDPAFSFKALHVTNYKGVGRVFAVDYENMTVYLLYEGMVDNTAAGIFSVPFKMETRGYVGDDPIAFKRFGRAMIGISTFDPLITVTAITDGFNEEKNLTPAPITKSPIDFYQHGHPQFGSPGATDPEEQKRMDYFSGDDNSIAIEDFEAYPVGPAPVPLPLVIGNAATVAGNRQQSVERFIVRSFGRWAALRVENDQGLCEITSCGIESTRAVNTGRTAA